VADASKTIDLIFNGVDKTQAATQAALRNLESFSGSVVTATQPIADFSMGAVKLEATLLAAGTAMLAFSVKAASDVDTGFRQISTIIDASAEDLGKFRDSILQYASTSTKPLAEITAALGAAIGSGVDWSKSLDLIATAEKLAVATRSDLDSTTKVLVSTLNSYGMEITDAGKISDLFFKIIDEGDIAMGDLANSFAKVAPIAKISGLSLEEVGAAIATLTASGIKPAESIEYLRGAISNIISPSGQAKDLAAELGLNFGAAGLKADGLAGLLQKVAVATGGSADKMKILFGDIGGFTAAATLAGPQAGKFAETLKEMANVAGATDAAFGKMSDSLGVSTARIAGAFGVLSVQIGTPLLDEFGSVATAIANIFAALGASVKDGALKELVSFVETLMADLAKTMEQVAKNLPAALEKADLSGFTKGIQSVIDAFGLLFDNIDITTVDGLAKAIEVAGAAFLGLSKFTAGVIESFKPLFDWLVKIGAQVDGTNPEIFKMAGEIGGAVTQINALAGGLAALMPALTALIDILLIKQGIGLVKAFGNFGGALPGVAAGLQAAGVALAAYWASDKVVQLVDALLKWKTANDKLNESQATTAEVQARSIPTLERFAETTGIAAKSIDEAMKLVDTGEVVWSDAIQGWVKAGDALGDIEDAGMAASVAIAFSNQAILDAANAADKAATGTGRLADAQAGTLSYAYKTVPIFDALTGAITGYEQQLVKSAEGTVKLGGATDKTNDSLKKTAEETKKAEETTRKWNEEVAKMNFQEKIKLIESQTAISVAHIQADAQKVTAAFKSVDTAIESTGKLLGDLFKLLGNDKLTFSEQWKIQEQIAKENDLRQKAFELQKKLIEATVLEMTERTKAMQRGDALIKIDGAGLQPHLEAFMWEILRTIQVRVNADGLKLLLNT
jgi:TP901 family phage tail tape measure protein